MTVNCMTCRHNDRAKEYCNLRDLHTDLGYVLHCVEWEPTLESEMRRLDVENASLRELANIEHLLAREGCAQVPVCEECEMRKLCDRAQYLRQILGLDAKEVSWEMHDG